MGALFQTSRNISRRLTPGTSEFCKSSKAIKNAFNKESLHKTSSKLDKKISGGTSYSSQIVYIQSLHYIRFSSTICPLQVPASDVDLRPGCLRNNFPGTCSLSPKTRPNKDQGGKAKARANVLLNGLSHPKCITEGTKSNPKRSAWLQHCFDRNIQIELKLRTL